MVVLGDTVARIKNALSRNKLEVEVVNSKFIRKVLDCLIKEGYIRGYYVKGFNIVVYLKYIENKSVINKINLVSKSSLRVISTFKSLKRSAYKGEYFVISNGKGVYLNKEYCYKDKGDGGLILIEIN